jgi:hypothetical protein
MTIRGCIGPTVRLGDGVPLPSDDFNGGVVLPHRKTRSRSQTVLGSRSVASSRLR